MRKGWEKYKIIDVCRLLNGRAYSKSELLSRGKTLVLRVGNFFTSNKWFYSDLTLDDDKYCDNGDLLYAWSASFGPKIWDGDKVIYHYHIWKVIPDLEKITKEFLFYFFQWDKELIKNAHGTGTTMLHVSMRSMNERVLYLPKLDEQKQIVEILDKAFADLEIVRANAEVNLKNAQDLFESYLSELFAKVKDNSKMLTLAEASLDFGRGKSKHRPRNDPKLFGGEFPFVQTGDIRNSVHFVTEFSQTYNQTGLKQSKLWPKGTICITIAANIAETAILSFDSCFPDSIIGMVVNETVASNEYVLYLLQSVKILLQAEGKGSAQDNLNLATFEDMKFPFPTVDEQVRIMTSLNYLRMEMEHAKENYDRKLALVDELKQSLLAKAFSGELLKDDNVIQLNVSANANTKAPEFTANIIAYAHLAHKRKQRDKTFGRVKAQKTLQLIEAIGGIDLGRNPQKDAAGPNDFQHMLRAEETARTNQFFEFVQQGSGYDFAERLKYNQFIAEARKSIEPFKSQIDKLLEIIIPMDSRQAEVFATVHAAWNNLLLDGKQPTNDEIIYEARENWHDDKLKIPKSEFETAIKLIKSHGVEPEGDGKRVIGNEKLL